MAEALSALDGLLLDRWHDAIGIRDALKDLEERLETQLENAAGRLESWLAPQGYQVASVGSKDASLEIVKPGWLNKKKEPYVSLWIAALFPYGYRRVDEEHPYVWVFSEGLEKRDAERFRVALADQLKGAHSDWLNEHCDLYSPAGVYIVSHGDKERLELARSTEALEQFIKAHLAPALPLGQSVDTALAAARSQS